MRKFYTLLLLALFALTGPLQARNLDQAVERAVSARTQAQQQPVARTVRKGAQQTQKPKKATPAKAQQDENTWYGVPIIDFKEYKRESQEVVKKQEKYNQLWTELFKFDEIINKINMQFQQGLPNYAKIIANRKYIYIGETHETPIVQAEIRKLIQTIRQVNPGKKILLATEFLERTHPLLNPLHMDGTDRLFGEGGTDYSIDELADKLHLDTLALDDDIIQFEKTDLGAYTLAKVGNRYVRAGLDNWAVTYNQEAANLVDDLYVNLIHEFKEWPAPSLITHYFLEDKNIQDYITELKASKDFAPWKKEIIKQVGPGNEEYIAIYMAMTEKDEKEKITIPESDLTTLAKSVRFLNALSASAWGALQRNYQWAQRIKQVEKDYDVVIVWSGNGHLDNFDQFLSVPTLLAHPQAVEFDFAPIDADNASENLELYAKREEFLCQKQLSTNSMVEVDPEKVINQVDGFCNALETIDTEKTFFIIEKEPEENTYSPKVQAIWDQIMKLTDGKADVTGVEVYYSVFLQ